MNLRGVSSQPCSESAGGVLVVVEERDVLSEHGLKHQSTQSAGQALSGISKTEALENSFPCNKYVYYNNIKFELVLIRNNLSFNK